MPKKILFVDDEPEFIYPQVEALEDNGYQVIIKTDSDGVLTVLRRVQFDLIILDLIMPNQNFPYSGDSYGDHFPMGAKIYQAVRQELGLVNIPIIFLSVVRDPAVTRLLRQSEEKYGHSLKFLTKPALSSEIVTEAQKVLGM